MKEQLPQRNSLHEQASLAACLAGSMPRWQHAPMCVDCEGPLSLLVALIYLFFDKTEITFYKKCHLK